MQMYYWEATMIHSSPGNSSSKALARAVFLSVLPIASGVLVTDAAQAQACKSGFVLARGTSE